MSDHDTQQLAMYMQRRDALQFGGNTTDGTFHPQWDEIGEPGQEEYVTDSAAAIAALKALGWVDRTALEAQLAETARLQAVIDTVRTWATNAAGEYLDHAEAHELKDILAPAEVRSALEVVKADTTTEEAEAVARLTHIIAGWDYENPEDDAEEDVKYIHLEAAAYVEAARLARSGLDPAEAAQEATKLFPLPWQIETEGES